jgi:dTDP-4-dehydrorhamnose 3,5-epimerase
MKLIETPIKGCFELHPKVFQDLRGRLVKTYHEDVFASNGLATDFAEEYYSVSNQSVLRGLHFQKPPNDHVKCITCLYGRILDVVVDLRKNSLTFKQYYSLELDSETCNMLYIPEGLAHGFYVLSEQAIILNRSNVVYKPESDSGIHWDSCGIKWPSINPVLSERDKQLIKLDDFNSPF